METAKTPTNPASLHAKHHAHGAQERDLIWWVAVQDRDAFERLYRLYTPRLAAFLYPWLRDDMIVDEVINDTMLVVWAKAAQFRPAMRLSSWIFGIARRKAFEAWRQNARQSPDLAEAISGEFDQESPEHLLHQYQQDQVVAQALATLPSQLRVVVEGAYYQALTYPEIAARLGCSVSTVKSRMGNARRRLSVHLRRMRRPPFDASPGPPRRLGSAA